MEDFWCIAIVLGISTLLAVGWYFTIELPQIRQHARYRRAQQDRVKARGFIHSECNNSLSERNNG